MVHKVYDHESVFMNNGKNRQTYNFVALKKECHDMSYLTIQLLKRYKIKLQKGINNSRFWCVA